MSTKKKITQWFVEPRDDWSNELISRLIGFSQVEAESIGLGISDGSGQSRNIWQCTWSQIDFLNRSQYRLQIKFRVHKRNGNTGPIRPAPDFTKFPSPRRRHKSSRTAFRPAA